MRAFVLRGVRSLDRFFGDGAGPLNLNLPARGVVSAPVYVL